MIHCYKNAAHEIVDMRCFRYLLHCIEQTLCTKRRNLKKKISIGPVYLPLNWYGVQNMYTFRNRFPKKWPDGNIKLTTSELRYMYIMSAWNTCNINNIAWKFTLILSKRYFNRTFSINRIHFTRIFLLFLKLVHVLTGTCIWHRH